MEKYIDKEFSEFATSAHDEKPYQTDPSRGKAYNLKSVASNHSLSDVESLERSEDAEKLFRNLFRGREVIRNETWVSTHTVQGKIVHCTENEVFVDCLIDFDEGIFEHRAFSKNLFVHLSKLKAGIPVLIKTRSKPGTIKIDIYPGEGIVNLEKFELKDSWDDLENSGLDEKLTEW
jgi:hypothetical protein